MERILEQSGVSLARLATLVKVVESGGIAVAANGDPATQSQYSRQLSELEEAIGPAFFIKDGRGRKPTLFARQLSAAYSAFASAVAELTTDATGTLSAIRIGAGDSVYRWLLLPSLSMLEGRFPKVSFELKNLRTSEVLKGVENGSVDIGIAEVREVPRGLETKAIRQLEFGLFFHPGTFGDQADERSVLRAEKLIGISGSGAYVSACRSAQRKSKARERFWLSFDSLPMVAVSLEQTKASAFLPLAMREELESKGFKCVESPSAKRFTRKFCLIVNRRTSKIRGRVEEVERALEEILQD